MNDPIVRIAARGDGVTAEGRHVPFAVPGDMLSDNGQIVPGPHHQRAPCRHFPECGGCQLQHADDEAYRDYLASRIRTALDQHGLETDIREPHLSPPKSRRRSTLRAVRSGNAIALGFNEAKSARIVNLQECHILRPELFALVDPLRALLMPMLSGRKVADINLSLVDQGLDVLLRGVGTENLREIEALTSFAQSNRLARLSVDRGLGSETLVEPEPVTVTLSGRPVCFPTGSFLQATQDGEAALIEAVQDAVSGRTRVADLFAGLGTFAIAVRASYAAEAARDAAAALKRAAPAMVVEHRDLYRRPLAADELSHFDAVILDPPRAGAEKQISSLAQCAIGRIAYVSCNPGTFARDARLLFDGGYRLDWVKPVGQFRWSTHVELAAQFSGPE